MQPSARVDRGRVMNPNWMNPMDIQQKQREARASHLGEGVAVLGRLPPAADHLAHLGLELAPEVRPVELAPLHSKGHREVAPGRALPERPRAGGEPRPADGARLRKEEGSGKRRAGHDSCMNERTDRPKD